MFDPNAVLAVQHIFSGEPERQTGVKVFFKDGTAKVYEGQELGDAVAAVKVAFQLHQ